MGQDINLTASDGFKLGAYRADPAGKPKAAIVVIQEIFGVNHHIRSVCDRLAKEGYDPAFGARPLRRAIQKYVESPLSVELLGGKFKDGAVVEVDVDEKENKIIFHTELAIVKKTKQKVEA